MKIRWAVSANLSQADRDWGSGWACLCRQRVKSVEALPPLPECLLASALRGIGKLAENREPPEAADGSLFGFLSWPKSCERLTNLTIACLRPLTLKISSIMHQYSVGCYWSGSSRYFADVGKAHNPVSFS